jgi:methanogenic corrinoid protein MtbC1
MPDTRERETLSIGALSRATRIPVETLRTWEQRYGAPMPIRKPSGHRLYPADAVDHLRRVGRLLAHGHRPGEILRLSAAQLDRLLSISEPAGAPIVDAAGDEGLDDRWIAARIERMRHATLDFDRAAVLHELRASWARLGPLRCLEDVVGPFLVQVGASWEEGTLEVRHEHLAFACVSDFLHGVREPFDQQATGPRVVATTLPGERHEGGLAMASLLMAVRGYRVVYLGIDTPLEQIVAAAASANAEAVVVSVSAATPRARAARDIAALRKQLPRRLPLWIGGAGAPEPTRGVEPFASFTELDARLRTHAG